MNFYGVDLGCGSNAKSLHVGPGLKGGIPTVRVFLMYPRPYLNEFKKNYEKRRMPRPTNLTED